MQLHGEGHIAKNPCQDFVVSEIVGWEYPVFAPNYLSQGFCLLHYGWHNLSCGAYEKLKMSKVLTRWASWIILLTYIRFQRQQHFSPLGQHYGPNVQNETKTLQMMRLQVYHTDEVQLTVPLPRTISGTHAWMTFWFPDRVEKAANDSHRLAIHTFWLLFENSFSLASHTAWPRHPRIAWSPNFQDKALSNWDCSQMRSYKGRLEHHRHILPTVSFSCPRMCLKESLYQGMNWCTEYLHSHSNDRRNGCRQSCTIASVLLQVRLH